MAFIPADRNVDNNVSLKTNLLLGKVLCDAYFTQTKTPGILIYFSFDFFSFKNKPACIM